MNQLYLFDHNTEGLFTPKILSFRLTIEIPEHLCDQLQEYLDQNEPPTACFIAQLYAKKIGDAFYLVIVVNLLGFYEKWSNNPFEPEFKDIILYLREKLTALFGKQFAEYFIQEEKLDCDFIEYSFIVEDKNVHVGMFERHANSDQMYKLSWDEYYQSYKESAKKDSCPKKQYSNFMLGIEYNYRENDVELYLRCDGPQLQDFFCCLEKDSFIAKRGVLLNALFNINIQRTICQEAYSYNCHSSVPTSESIKKLYDELCENSKDE